MTEEDRSSRRAKLPHYHAKYEMFFIGDEPVRARKSIGEDLTEQLTKEVCGLIYRRASLTLYL